MSWEIRQIRRFARVYKKLYDNVATDADEAVELISEDTGIGEKKKGDLVQHWVYMFRSQGQLYLLGYTRKGLVRLIYIEAIGPHENFYLISSADGLPRIILR